MVTTECPVCLEASVVALISKRAIGREFRISSCSRCTAQFVSSDLSTDALVDYQKSFFESEAYDPHVDDPTSNRAYWLGEKRIIYSLGYAGGRALDIGCYGGHFLDNLGSNWEKHGVELAERPAGIASSKGIRVYNRPIESLSLPAAHFDVATMYAVLEHLNDPRWVISEVSRVLRPGGLFVVMTGAANSWKARLKRDQWHMYCPPIHKFFFTRRSLLILLGDFGFRERYYKYTRGGMFWLDGNRIPTKIFRLFEKVISKLLLERSPLWHMPLYDHLYLYAIKEER